MLNKEQFLSMLKKDVVPALGCTEPVCVALCCAHASALTKDDIRKISVEVNSGIYKNGMSAGIPHCEKVGLNYASVIGTLLKNPDKQLQLFEDINDTILTNTEEYIKNNKVTITLNKDISTLYVKCCLYTDAHTYTCIIKDAHTNVILIKKDDEIIFEKDTLNNVNTNIDFTAIVKSMSIQDMLSLVEQCTYEDLAFMLDGVQMNEELAAYSSTNKIGIGISSCLKNAQQTNLFTTSALTNMLTKVASAAENRLDGCPFPTMSSAGAGTKGLVVILPVHELALSINASSLNEVRALAFAHILNTYINSHIGKLSSMCSCVMASSTAASAAMIYLMGGTIKQIHYAIRNMCGCVTGMICDGGKVGCALKVASGTSAAFMCAINAINNVALRVSDGICAETGEDCIANIAYLAKNTHKEMDGLILDIMTNKK